MGAGEDVAAEVSRHLVRSNLSGHDSHGVILLPTYVAQADRGELVAAARPVMLRESEVVALTRPRPPLTMRDGGRSPAPRHGVAAVRHPPTSGGREYTDAPRRRASSGSSRSAPAAPASVGAAARQLARFFDKPVVPRSPA
jgi:hypothetical protein